MPPTHRFLINDRVVKQVKALDGFWRRKYWKLFECALQTIGHCPTAGTPHVVEGVEVWTLSIAQPHQPASYVLLYCIVGDCVEVTSLVHEAETLEGKLPAYWTDNSNVA